jgi:hypothetical protein
MVTGKLNFGEKMQVAALQKCQNHMVHLDRAIRIALRTRGTMGIFIQSMLVCALLFASEAAAQIRVDEARIDDRMLIVRGVVSKPGQIVTLDRNFRTRSVRRGQFSFRVRHTPFVCRIELRSGGVQKTVKVGNCVMDNSRG